MNREQLKHLVLAGTVTFPATFPGLADLSLEAIAQDKRELLCGPNGADQLLVATERSSPRVTIHRKVLLSAVSAVFIPHSAQQVDINEGTWLRKNEIGPGLTKLLSDESRVRGIVFVTEQTATLLAVSAGMTAAESSQYYPPLPSDRSVNHYDPYTGLSHALPPKSCLLDEFKRSCSPLGSCATEDRNKDPFSGAQDDFEVLRLMSMVAHCSQFDLAPFPRAPE